MSVRISLVHLTKQFTKEQSIFTAVDDVNLEVASGELVTLLGPSGCGKTTTLRMIAGFETPSNGSILFDGSDVTSVMVNKRDIGFVFQSYALFPHMNVFDNVAYGLRARRLGPSEISKAVEESIELVGLKKSNALYPNQLSGGEQQRVALARVLALKPKVLLMDEPLSNLDAKLRIHMRTEIRRLQKHLGVTCLYVTHDQKEALTLADRIVVMNKGHVEQVETPFELYANPASLFVADFIGGANVLQGIIESVHSAYLEVNLNNVLIAARAGAGQSFSPGDRATLVIRPESISLHPVQDALSGRIITRTFVGDRIEYEIQLSADSVLRAEVPYSYATQVLEEGSETGFTVNMMDVVALRA